MPLLKRGSGDISYEYLSRGERPCLILSHSLGSNRNMWLPQIEAFSKHYDLLLYDHPGHGDSGLRSEKGTIADCGRDVLVMMDECGLDKALFCGLSLGGMVGMWLGANAGDRFRKLVLCSTAARIEDTKLLKTRIQKIPLEGMNSIGDSVLEKWFTPDFRARNPLIVNDVKKMILSTQPRGYADTAEIVCRLDLRNSLQDIHVPCLLIYGESDQATPPAWNLAVAEQIPQCRTLALKAAHLLNLEVPRQFNDEVLRFLEDRN